MSKQIVIVRLDKVNRGLVLVQVEVPGTCDIHNMTVWTEQDGHSTAHENWVYQYTEPVDELTARLLVQKYAHLMDKAMADFDIRMLTPEVMQIGLDSRRIGVFTDLENKPREPKLQFAAAYGTGKAGNHSVFQEARRVAAQLAKEAIEDGTFTEPGWTERARAEMPRNMLPGGQIVARGTRMPVFAPELEGFDNPNTVQLDWDQGAMERSLVEQQATGRAVRQSPWYRKVWHWLRHW